MRTFGAPDLLAPSAYREVEISDELLLAAPLMYAALLAGPEGAGLPDGAGEVSTTYIASKEQAEQLAADKNLELIFLDI